MSNIMPCMCFLCFLRSRLCFWNSWKKRGGHFGTVVLILFWVLFYTHHHSVCSPHPHPPWPDPNRSLPHRELWLLLSSALQATLKSQDDLLSPKKKKKLEPLLSPKVKVEKVVCTVRCYYWCLWNKTKTFHVFFWSLLESLSKTYGSVVFCCRWDCFGFVAWCCLIKQKMSGCNAKGFFDQLRQLSKDIGSNVDALKARIDGPPKTDYGSNAVIKLQEMRKEMKSLKVQEHLP